MRYSNQYPKPIFAIGLETWVQCQALDKHAGELDNLVPRLRQLCGYYHEIGLDGRVDTDHLLPLRDEWIAAGIQLGIDAKTAGLRIYLFEINDYPKDKVHVFYLLAKDVKDARKKLQPVLG